MPNGKRSHNPKTRWNNSKRLDTLWAIRSRIVKSKSGEEKTVTENVYVPHGTLWDPDMIGKKIQPEPYDSLHLDWMEEMSHWIIDNGYRLTRKATDRGSHQYIVTDGDGKHMLTVESERNIMMEPRPKRRQRRKRSKME